MVVGVLGLFSGAAVAGGRCDYEGHAVSDTDKLPVVAMAELTDPEFLVRLQKLREEAERLENLLELPVTYN